MNDWWLDVAAKTASTVAVGALVWLWHEARRWLQAIRKIESAAVELAEVDLVLSGILRRMAYQIRVTREFLNLDSSGIRTIESDLRLLRDRYWEYPVIPDEVNRGKPAPRRVLGE